MNEKLKERLEWMVSVGYTADLENGFIYSLKGKKIGSVRKDGYVNIVTSIENRFNILAHQFIYFFATGEVGEEIDHINQNKADNRLENLRLLTQHQNKFNTFKTTKGYYWNKSNKKWQAGIRLNNKTIYLGSFNNEDDAREAYLQAKEKYHIIK